MRCIFVSRQRPKARSLAGTSCQCVRFYEDSFVKPSLIRLGVDEVEHHGLAEQVKLARQAVAER